MSSGIGVEGVAVGADEDDVERRELVTDPLQLGLSRRRP
jgi:hypothetical protein